MEKLHRSPIFYPELKKLSQVSTDNNLPPCESLPLTNTVVTLPLAYFTAQVLPNNLHFTYESWLKYTGKFCRIRYYEMRRTGVGLSFSNFAVYMLACCVFRAKCNFGVHDMKRSQTPGI
jgi:hypothetical protein